MILCAMLHSRVNMLAVYSEELLKFGTPDSVYLQLPSGLYVEVLSFIYSLTTHCVMVCVCVCVGVCVCVEQQLPFINILNKRTNQRLWGITGNFLVFILFWYKKKDLLLLKSKFWHFLVHVFYIVTPHQETRNYRMCYRSDSVSSPAIAYWYTSKRQDLIWGQTVPNNQVIIKVYNYPCLNPAHDRSSLPRSQRRHRRVTRGVHDPGLRHHFLEAWLLTLTQFSVSSLSLWPTP